MPVSETIAAVFRAADEQRSWLDRNPHPPLDATDIDAIRFYGGPKAALSLWRMVRAVEALRAEVGR